MTAAALTVAMAQIAPVFLDRAATLAKVVARIREAGQRGSGLVVFGEALVPGYPFWLSRTDGARFEADDQKELHALYADQAVQVEAGHLESVCGAARAARSAVVLGIIERPADRGHSLYCSRVFVDADGNIASVHRKLMPTYEERLSWAIGDGAGLVVHPVGPFRVGALNCWENWMPLARAALYAAGEDLHVALWPGSRRLIEDITRFVARESRSFVISVSGVLRSADVPAIVPYRRRMLHGEGDIVYDGGSAIARPDGRWLVEPLGASEDLVVAELEHAAVRRERQNFDAAGHYARPDVLRLQVDRRRQSSAEWIDDPA
jgi:nitrilase